MALAPGGPLLSLSWQRPTKLHPLQHPLCPHLHSDPQEDSLAGRECRRQRPPAPCTHHHPHFSHLQLVSKDDTLASRRNRGCGGRGSGGVVLLPVEAVHACAKGHVHCLGVVEGWRQKGMTSVKGAVGVRQHGCCEAERQASHKPPHKPTHLVQGAAAYTRAAAAAAAGRGGRRDGGCVGGGGATAGRRVPGGGRIGGGTCGGGRVGQVWWCCAGPGLMRARAWSLWPPRLFGCGTAHTTAPPPNPTSPT